MEEVPTEIGVNIIKFLPSPRDISSLTQVSQTLRERYQPEYFRTIQPLRTQIRKGLETLRDLAEWWQWAFSHHFNKPTTSNGYYDIQTMEEETEINLGENISDFKTHLSQTPLKLNLSPDLNYIMKLVHQAGTDLISKSSQILIPSHSLIIQTGDSIQGYRQVTIYNKNGFSYLDIMSNIGLLVNSDLSRITNFIYRGEFPHPLLYVQIE